MKKQLYWAVKVLSTAVLTPFFRLEVSGSEHLPLDTSFVLLPKHQRWEDIPLLGMAAPRPLHYVAKYELFQNPLSGWFLRSLGGIPLNRQKPLESRRSLRRIIALLKEGEGVVVFPEGTYFRDVMGPGQLGMVRLILSRLNLPFIPVGISYEKSGPGRRCSVCIRFGASFYGADASSPHDLLEQIMAKIAGLSGLGGQESPSD